LEYCLCLLEFNQPKAQIERRCAPSCLQEILALSAGVRVDEHPPTAAT
jgi:hypothetical protein